MFLSSLFRHPNGHSVVSRGASFCKAAVQAELDYLQDVDCSHIELDTSGDFLIVDGIANSHGDLLRIVETAVQIVGSGRVISRAIVCSIAA